MNIFCSNINKQASHVFLILEVKFLNCTNILSIQTIEFLIFAYFSDIFSIITRLFGIYNFKKHTVYFILYQ